MNFFATFFQYIMDFGAYLLYMNIIWTVLPEHTILKTVKEIDI